MRISEHGQTARRLSPLALAFLAVALLLGAGGGAVAGAMITGSQIKDGTVTTADIKNGSLTKADLLDEPIAWGVQGGPTGEFTTSSYVPLVGRNVTVPAAGFLTINASLYAEDSEALIGEGRLEYALRINNKVVSRGSVHYADFDGNYAGENAAVNAVVPAPKGIHKVELVIREQGAGSYLYGGRMTVLYTSTGVSTGFNQALRPATPRQAQR